MSLLEYRLRTQSELEGAQNTFIHLKDLANIFVLLYYYNSQDLFLGWKSIKKFDLNDKLTMHLLHYQQVRYSLEQNIEYFLMKIFAFCRLASLLDRLMMIGVILSGMRMIILKICGEKEKRV